MPPEMTTSQAGKVALITGGSSGIGLALAKAFVKAGGRAALVARTEKTLNEAVALLGGEAHAAAFSLDVTKLDALQTLPQRVIEKFGTIDLLCNNAGLNHRGAVLDRSPAELIEVITANLLAPMILSRAAAPLMREGSAIVNVASLAGMVPVHHEAAYSASKAGLRAFTRVLADELKPKIRVGSVCPGPVDTNFFGDIERVPNLVFSQPMSSAEEVAEAVLAVAAGEHEEIALPWFSGKLASVGYLSPTLLRLLRPAMDRRGAKAKAAYRKAKGV
jgi:short-subunit dehydrogenase